MKPVTTIVVILLSAISIAQLLRLIFQVAVVANGVQHSYLVEHFWLYCPCCTGFHAMAGE
jgi:hypothetical protein